MLPALTLILGGAASGKSAFAETLIVAAKRPRIYVATAQCFDEEMRNKIAKHQDMRGPDWETREAPLDPHSALACASADHVVLFDCATMWLSNHMLAETNLEQQQKKLIDSLLTCRAPIVIVSNEVGLSVVPENALARKFRQAQGELNQALAQNAELVVNVIAGLPQVLKGELP